MKLLSRRFLIKFLSQSGILFLLFGSFFAIAQSDDDSTTAAGGGEKKFLSLYTGIYYDEPVPLAPERIDIEGTFRAFTGVQYRPDNRTVRFNPKAAGNGTLTIKDPATQRILYEFIITVEKTDLQSIARQIRSLLNEIDGINIKIINNKVIVDGQILLPKDMNRIHSVVKQFGNAAASLVTLSPLAQTKIAQFIERKINNPEIRVSAINGKFILEGVANDKDEKDRSEIIAKTFVPDVVIDEAVADKKVLERRTDVVINLITIKAAAPQEPGKIVSLTVHFVELQKDYSNGFRIQWTPSLGDDSKINFTSGGNSPGNVVTTITGTINGLLPRLNWAKEHGHARVLQASTIVVQDREKGTLNSTTRLPYQVINAQGQPSTNFEEAGLRTSITPVILGARSDSISLDMNFSVKSLISYTEAGPLTSARDIQTKLVVRSGASAAVGGLISSDTGTNYNKLPSDAAKNPIISIYASKDFRRNQSQFVVFVTPVIKSSASAGSDKIKRKFRLKD